MPIRHQSVGQTEELQRVSSQICNQMSAVNCYQIIHFYISIHMTLSSTLKLDSYGIRERQKLEKMGMAKKAFVAVIGIISLHCLKQIKTVTKISNKCETVQAGTESQHVNLQNKQQVRITSRS